MSRLPDHVGIDFGNHSVKAVELTKLNSTNPELINFGSQRTPHGVLNSPDDVHQQQLADAVKTLFSTSKIKTKNVVMAMPESSVFTRFVELPGVKEEEIDSALYYQAKEFIPMNLEDVQMSSVTLGYNQEKNAFKVLLVAAPLKIVDIYVNVAQRAGLEPVAIETESVALGRAMYRSSGLKHVVMLDFGATSTDMSIMLDGQLVFSQSIAIGSDSLTQAIVNKFNFEYQQAEEYKRNYGVVESILEGKMYQTLSPILSALMTEVSRGIEFYKNKTLASAPTNVLLSGDGALLPGLADFISKSLGVETLLSNPWNNIKVPDKYASVVTKSASSFAVAIGLALKDE